MHAIVIVEPGGPEVLAWQEVPDPQPGPGEVVVETVAAGLNRADLLQRQGRYPPPAGAAPYPGVEVSGRVAELHPTVTGWAVGDEVCALVDGGAYAERVVVPAGQLLRIPMGIGLTDSAALPAAACTVWSSVLTEGRLAAGESCLIHGGASGVGTIAIQVAKAIGARVTCTVAGPERAARCRAIGADAVVDYRTEDFVASGPFEVIMDIIGGPYLQRNLEALAPDGRLVVIGLQGGSRVDFDLMQLRHKRGSLHLPSLRTRPPDQKAAITAGVDRDVWPLVEAGSVRPVISRTVPLADAAQAHELMAAGGQVGKILLTI